MEIGASLVAGAEPFELLQAGDGALDDPAHLAQSGTVGDAASGDQRLDAPLPQQAAVLVEVVAPVRIQTPGLAARASPGSPDRRDRVEQGQEMGDVVPVAAGERDGERGSVPRTPLCRPRSHGGLSCRRRPCPGQAPPCEPGDVFVRTGGQVARPHRGRCALRVLPPVTAPPPTVEPLSSAGRRHRGRPETRSGRAREGGRPASGRPRRRHHQEGGAITPYVTSTNRRFGV